MPSFDQIGNIAVFNEKISKEKAKNFLSKNIKTVGYKSKSYSGKLRLPKINILVGKKTKETVHKENKCLFKLNIEKCYFSVRSGSERLRIAKQVKNNELILCMFSGVSPFSLVIEKNSNPKEVYAIELNKTCHKYAKENLILNKSNKIKLFQGDVKKVLPKINKKFNRILMPLPKDSESYLDLALKYIKKKGIIHFYTFGQEKEIKDIKIKILKHAKRIKVKKVVKCGDYAPYTFRLCFDLAIT
ncbi:MAG: class I SAM-dependent methyltransferase family protein [Nanoarchaeota archaeon]|nr:class I SAM-dependent methyltransferase family protein [Nanoarchaeota archaeon]